MQYVKLHVWRKRRRRPPTDCSACSNIQPWSTYELARQVERSLGWFWPRTERKIYDEAKCLVDSGHATAKPEPTGSRPRTVYKITAKGRRELRTWLGETSAPPKLEAEALVRVFFSDAGNLDQLRATLDDLAATARENLEQLRRSSPPLTTLTTPSPDAATSTRSPSVSSMTTMA